MPHIGHPVHPKTDNAQFESLRHRTTSREERVAFGRSLREQVPVRSLADWDPSVRSADPIDLIRGSHEGRVPELVAVRVGRMASSPYGFLRGSAVVMAHDVAHLPASGIRPVVCGDAHLGNFGFYRSPEGAQVIDLNDFDEAHPGAWEWDLRRLATAVVCAGRENGYSEQNCADAVANCVASYRSTIAELATQPLLRRSFERLDVDTLRDRAQDASLREAIVRSARTARKRTSDRALPRFTQQDEQGNRRIVEEPPLITRLPDDEYNAVAVGLDDYLWSLAPHWRRVVGGYHLVDIAHKVVGVGSVGLRAYVALLEGSSPDDVLFLQLKEARRSVLAPYVHGDVPRHSHQGQRVVEYQQALQSTSDPLLGWTRIDGRDYYVRMFRNMKGTIPLNDIGPGALADYAGIVGALLGKGHARTAGASMISGYLGGGGKVTDAFVRFARLYADQNEADHAALVKAAREGTLPIADGALESMGSAFRPGG